MAKLKHHLHTDFDRLETQVSDDPEAIKAAASRLTPKMLDLSNYGTPEERKDAELFFEAETRLKNEKKRKELIQEIYRKAADMLDATLELRAGAELSDAVETRLLTILAEQFNFEAKLGSQKLEDFYRERGLSKGKPIPKVEVGKARLVDDLRATPRDDGVLLSWRIPEKDCDAVVLVRTQGAPAKSHTEGTELIKGKLDNHIDRTAVRGKKYIYSVFSVLGDTPSSSCRWCEGFRAPEPVLELRARYEHPSVRLSWKMPEGCKEVRIFRSTSAISGIPISAGRALPPPGCNQLEVVRGTSHADSDVLLGTTYHYHAIADHGEGQLSEAVSATPVTTPKPLPAPKIKGTSTQPGKITVEWLAGTDMPVKYRLYRRTSSGAPAFEDDEPLYQGPDTRYDDRNLDVGESYWYYVLAVTEGLTSTPLRIGPVVAVGEVQLQEPQPGIRSIQLRWKSPPRVKQVMVRRREDSAPGSLTEGEEVPGGGPTGLLDKGVEPGKLYAYRIACIFHDADGREVATTGVTTAKLEPFDTPLKPKNVKLGFSKGLLQLDWEPVRGATFCVFRRDSDPGTAPGVVVPAADLEVGGQRLSLKGGRGIEDNHDPDQPWYVLATILRGNLAVVQRRIYLAPIDLLVEKQEEAVLLRWSWLEGLEKVKLTRRVLGGDGKEDPGERHSWIVERRPGEPEGESTDALPDPKVAQIRSYRLDPVNTTDSPLVILNAGGDRKLNFGPTTYIFYWIVPAKKILGLTRSPAKLKIRLDRKVVNFPGVRLLAQSEDAEDDEEGEELLVWPEGAMKPRTIGPIEEEIDLPPLSGGEKLFGNLYLKGGNRQGLKIKPMQPIDKRQL